MRRALTTTVAAGLLAIVTLDAREERRAGWFDLGVRGGAPALAVLGIDADERALALPVLLRALYEREAAGMAAPPPSLPGAGAASGAAVRVDVPAPLSDEVWRELLRLQPGDDLFARFLADRNALLTAVGLMSSSASIRDLLTRDRELLRFVYSSAAAPFFVAARALRVDDGRVIVPGGRDAEIIWQALAEAPPARAGSFLRALLSRDEGRMAWYFDTIAALDEPRLAAVWPGERAEARIEQARAIYEVFRDSEPQWRLSDQPLRRNVADAWTLLTQSDVVGERLAGPQPQRLWELVFSDSRVTPDRARRALREPSAPLSMASLLRLALLPPRDRRPRFEVFRLAQRVFHDAPATDWVDLAVALNGHQRFRALLLALERMHITTPATWAALVAAADHVAGEASDERDALVAFQAAVALVERVRHSRAIDAASADGVLNALATAVRANRQVAPSVAGWITESLVPALPRLVRPDAWTRATAYESTIIQALAGPADRRPTAITWEGLAYTVDVAGAEHERVRTIRSLLPSPGLDAAIASQQGRDITAAMTALVYAAAAGDAAGPIALSRDLATRHDFGFKMTTLMRQVVPWAPPEERQGMGVWHVQGSLIGLDLGLSRLSLRRLASEDMPAAPSLTLNDLATLTRTMAAMVPAELADSDRDEIAAAIAGGRARVAAATAGTLDALAAEAGMSAVARQVLPWIHAHHPAEVITLFSLRDLLWLGKPALAPGVLDRWGMSAEGLDGRQTLTMPRPARWEDFAGRSERGQMMTQVPDLTLRLVEETARLRLPAALIPSLLAFAISDYFHELRVRFPDDWWRMTRHARSLEGARIEDYVAALTGSGPLRAQ